MTRIRNLFVIIILVLFLVSCATPTPHAPPEGENKLIDKEENKDITKDEKMGTVKPEPEKFAKIETIDSLESVAKDHEKRILMLEKENKSLLFQISDLNQDNRISKKIISQLRNDVFSLSEVISTNKKEIEIIKRGLRSGIFEDLNPLEKTPSSASGYTMLPDILESRSNYEEKPNTISPEPTHETASHATMKPMSASQILANAELKIRQAQFGEAIVSIEEMKKNFPNYDDGGKSNILASEAWLKMGEYNNVFNELRTFYLKYPASPELSHAKLLEGQAYEKMNRKNKAADLYQEVIALSPQSNDALNAREGMLRMRDAK